MYLLACSVMMLLASYQGLRTFIATSDIRALHKRLHNPIWLYMIPAGLMTAPIMASIFDELRLQGGHPIETSARALSALHWPCLAR